MLRAFEWLAKCLNSIIYISVVGITSCLTVLALYAVAGISLKLAKFLKTLLFDS